MDPVPRLLALAEETTGGRARRVLGDARQLDLDDESFAAVLLMGPLYHLPDPQDRLAAQIEVEVEAAGFTDPELIGVEGHAWLLANLESLLHEPTPLLDVLRLVEREPSMLGVSAHIITASTKP